MSDFAPVEKFISVFAVLRKKLIYCFAAVLLGSIVGWVFSEDLLRIMQLPFAKVMGPERHLVFTSPQEGFMAYVIIGLLVGAILAAPYLFLQLWWVIAPVFYRKQRRLFMFLAMTSAVVFVGGALFGYFGILPAAFSFLVAGFESRAPFEAFLKVGPFLSFSSKLLIVFGLSFELPVVMFILGILGIVDARMLWRGFRYAAVIIFVAAAVLTPPDVLTQIMLGGPLCLLYLLGVLVVAITGRRRKQQT